jgi:hypothetical protein
MAEWISMFGIVADRRIPSGFPVDPRAVSHTIAAKTWFGRLTISASGHLKANAKHYHAANKKRNS